MKYRFLFLYNLTLQKFFTKYFTFFVLSEDSQAGRNILQRILNTPNKRNLLVNDVLF